MIDPDQVITRLRSQMSRGQIVLFTGAGFSRDAYSRGGRRLPSSQELRDEFLELAFPGDPPEEGTTLGEAFGVALQRSPTETRALLEKRLSVDPTSLSDYYRLFFSQPWHRIYTLNVDDLEMAAAARFDLVRELRAVSATTQAADAGHQRSRLAHLEVVHLNGRLSDDPAHVTFSERQYAERSAGPDSWYQRCAVELRLKPVVFVGTELRESTLWNHIELRRRQLDEADILPPGGVLVTKDLTKARTELLRSHNVDWLDMTAQEFATRVLGAESYRERRRPNSLNQA